METPNILKGFLYPSSRVSRCPRFSECLVSKKCQNYDPHQLDCAVCESRVTPQYFLGGYVPEGEYYPDVQAAFKIITKRLHKAIAHPDSPHMSFNLGDIVEEQEKFNKSTEILRKFQAEKKLDLEETITNNLGEIEARKYDI